jgi:serine/threonine-protein kinase RsbT
VALAWTPEVKRPDVPVISESKEVRVAIEREADIVAARQTGRLLAAGLGFSSSDATIVATAISELARNIVIYAKRGEIILKAVTREDQSAVIVTTRDEGVWLVDLFSAMKDGCSTSRRLGAGLSGVKRIMDEFDIRSDAGKGTMVTIVKWHPSERQVG